MSSGFKKTAAAIVMTAMVMTPIATAGLVLTTDAAFAKSEKSSEKSKGKSKSSSRSAGKSSRGMIARELKNLNAANSWKNGQGYMNANPDSNIGIIKTYYDVRFLQTAPEMALAEFNAMLDVANYNLFECAEDEPAADADCGDLVGDQNFVDAYPVAVMPLEDAVAVTVGFSADAFDLIKPDGWDDPEGNAIAYFDAALGF